MCQRSWSGKPFAIRQMRLLSRRGYLTAHDSVGVKAAEGLQGLNHASSELYSLRAFSLWMGSQIRRAVAFSLRENAHKGRGTSYTYRKNALAYLAMFAIPVVGAKALRRRLPRWVAWSSGVGFLATSFTFFLTAYPFVDVVNAKGYAARFWGRRWWRMEWGIGFIAGGGWVGKGWRKSVEFRKPQLAINR